MTTAIAVKERPIIFSGPMVQAILEDKKTQTRRVIKPQPIPELGEGIIRRNDQYRNYWRWFDRRPGRSHKEHIGGWQWVCPYGDVGELLWVRETWAVYGEFKNGTGYCYHADGDKSGVCWKSSMFMPRRVSRLTLEITEVRAQRLQDISEEDICHELGCPVVWPGPGPEPYKRDLFGVWSSKWNQINGKRKGCTWQDNPWVWAVSFRRVTP